MRCLYKFGPVIALIGCLTAEQQLRVSSGNAEGVFDFFDPYLQFSVEHLTVDNGTYYLLVSYYLLLSVNCYVKDS